MRMHNRQIISENGEGVILRRPNSLYESGRSASLIKIKVCVRVCEFVCV